MVKDKLISQPSIISAFYEQCEGSRHGVERSLDSDIMTQAQHWQVLFFSPPPTLAPLGWHTCFAQWHSIPLVLMHAHPPLLILHPFHVGDCVTSVETSHRAQSQRVQPPLRGWARWRKSLSR